MTSLVLCQCVLLMLVLVVNCYIFNRSLRYVALKIVKSARHYTEAAIDEIDLLKKVCELLILLSTNCQFLICHLLLFSQVASSNPHSLGWPHVVQMYDSFRIVGPHGTRILCVT